MAIESILDCIGNTPTINLKNVGLPHVYAKAAHLNPSGSIKELL